MGTSIYDNDYSTMTTTEQTALQLELELEKEGHPLGSKFRTNRYRKYPKAARHYKSLFPGHFLDAVDLQDKATQLAELTDEFQQLVDETTTGERQVLNFIKNKKTWFLIGSIVKTGYTFGHHALYLFPEFPLGTNYKADYLLVGLSSEGYSFVFVELESPNGNITTADGDFGSTIRKGVFQVEQWQEWIEGSFSDLRNVFEKALRDEKSSLHRDFIVFDRTKVHFAVIAGRRKDFKESTRRKRRTYETNRIKILHYDNLIDNARQAIGSLTY